MVAMVLSKRICLFLLVSSFYIINAKPTQKELLHEKETYTIDNVDFAKSRHRRAVFLTDQGLGSRIQASSAAARMALADSVFGSYGPGKRAGKQDSSAIPVEQIYKFYDIYDDSDDKLTDLNRSLNENLIKKRPYSSDSGYGSRIQIGEQVAKDRAAFKDVFGSYGAGRR